jgi:hypothetical protein
VAQVPLRRAIRKLRKAFHDIADLAQDIEKPKPAKMTRRLLDAVAPPVWTLALDETCACGIELSPRLPFGGPRDFTGADRAPRVLARAAPPLSSILKPIQLDALTVADDADFLTRIALQPNVPTAVNTG